jgi:pyruvate dehydrogenase E2 component (dihydrolipoamide acetyltransferase)
VHPEDEEVPLTAVRRVTARRLTESVTTAPHFYLTSVVDVGALLAFRKQINAEAAESGVKVSVTDLLIRACAVTLRRHPQVNSSWGGDKIIRRGRVNVGLAVALDDGLIVPVVRDADRKTLTEIATEAHDLAARAREGKLGLDEFSGGTFTISNLGMFGIDHFTAVINPPEAAILAVGAAVEEPVLRDGQLTSRTTMKLTLSIDHRVLDGATGAAFARDLKQTLEAPLHIVI